jgi:hypothetical protein
MENCVIIQDTWNEQDDQDLLNYMKNNKIEYQTLSRYDILNVNPYDYRVIFADTSIIQKLLDHKLQNYDCYHSVFKDFYKRSIEIVTYHDFIQNPTMDVFVKPYKNDKSFEAVIVENTSDLDLIKVLDPSDLIYKCSRVTFVNEYRLFVYDYKKYHIIESSEFLISPNKIQKIEPDVNFIDEILEINPFEYIIIDIGCIKKTKKSYDWAIVEINPPFSLTSYNLPIDIYFNYCINAWKSILN